MYTSPANLRDAVSKSAGTRGEITNKCRRRIQCTYIYIYVYLCGVVNPVLCPRAGKEDSFCMGNRVGGSSYGEK